VIDGQSVDGVPQSRVQVTMPLISVVMPAYNSASHIRQAIESALAQVYPALEIVVVDDGSTDQTRDIVASFGAPVRLLTQANQGSAVARNTGIRSARGTHIAFLDADDVWWPHKLRLQMEELARTRLRMCYSRFIVWPEQPEGGFTDPNTEFAVEPNPNLSTGALLTGYVYAELLLDCIVWTSTVVVEKHALEEAGMFDPALRKGQDYDLWLRLSRQLPMLGIDRPTALYRSHIGNITKAVRAENYEYLVISRARERWGDRGPDGRAASSSAVEARLYRSALHHGLEHLRAGNPEVAVESLRLAMRHGGLRPDTAAMWLYAATQCLIRRRIAAR
jgi:glycosyltransferase involved in cell wall biosynthesis